MNIVKQKRNIANEELLNKAIVKLENISLKLNDDLTKFIKKWIEETANYFFSSYPSATKNMSKEDVSKFWSEVNSLVESIEAFEDDSIWWHKNQEKRYDYKNYEKLIEEKVRDQIGGLGYILAAFSFIERDIFDSEGFNCFRGGDNDYRFRYNYEIHWSRDVKIGFDHYNNYYKYAIELI